MIPDEATLRALAGAVAQRVPSLLDEIAEALRSDWPDYAAFLDDHRAEVTASADAVVLRLITLTSGRDEEALFELDTFDEIGRQQWRDGKELSDLLSAYRTGVRVFWRHVSAVALDVGVPPEVVATLAERVFFFVDRVSSSSARGYVREQQEAGAERERSRDELVTLMLSGRAGPAEVAAAALRAGWPVPAEAAVVLVPPGPTAGTEVRSRLGPSALPIRGRVLVGAIVPHPSRNGGRAALRRLLHGVGATVGAAVELERLPASLHLAELAARLRQEELLDDDPVFVAEHLDAIIVHRDDRLLRALHDQVLAPLATATPSASRERLRETLAAWLRHMGDRRAMAAELHVHPQTVRYRLGRLHELFGADLDDPDVRARMTLALAWRAGSGSAPGR